jgi:transposase-like protein
LPETPFFERMEHMKTKSRYSPEVRERAAKMVFEHVEEYSSQWAAIQSIAQKIDCSSAGALPPG